MKKEFNFKPNEIQQQIYKMLSDGVKTKSLINIGDFRGIGKTITLIDFAHKNGYLAIASNYYSSIFDNFIPYEYIDQLEEEDFVDSQFVIDENVDFNKLPKYIQNRVVTGYKNSNISKNSINSINSHLISVLDNEVKQLITKINKAREEENWGTYKNLILSLKQVIELKNEEEKKNNNDNIIVSNITLPNVIDSEDFIKTLKDLPNLVKQHYKQDKPTVNVNPVDLAKRILRMNNTYNSQLNKIEKELKNIGINIVNNDNSLKTFSEVLVELSSIWKELNRKEDEIVKTHIAETLVGIRDRNLLYEMINNIEQTI